MIVVDGRHYNVAADDADVDDGMDGIEDGMAAVGALAAYFRIPQRLRSYVPRSPHSVSYLLH